MLRSPSSDAISAYSFEGDSLPSSYAPSRRSHRRGGYRGNTSPGQYSQNSTSSYSRNTHHQDFPPYLNTDVDSNPSCPNYHGNNHRSTYNPGPSSENSSMVYQNRQDSNRTSSVNLIKLMITYVENSTMFYGQHMSPELLVYMQTLDECLPRITSVAPPATIIKKTMLYATTWAGAWYRCITCGPPDSNNNVDVYFVDYGNRDRRHVRDLIRLRSPNIIDIPFLACAFKLTGLMPTPLGCSEGVRGMYNTRDILEGVVCSMPNTEQRTDIVLLEKYPERSGHHTTNALMIDEKFAQEESEGSFLSMKPLPCFYRYKHMVEKLNYMNEFVREKDQQIKSLKSHILKFDPEVNLDTLSIGSNDTSPSQNAPSSLSQLTSPSPPPSLNIPASIPSPSVKHVSVATEVDFTDFKDPSETVTTETDNEETVVEAPPLPQPTFGELLKDLYKELDAYSQYSKGDGDCTEYLEVKDIYTRVLQCEITRSVLDKQQQFKNAKMNLEVATSTIKGLSSCKGLDDAVEKRDEAIEKVVTAINEYLHELDNFNLGDVRKCVSELQDGLRTTSSPSTSATTFTTPEEAMKAIIDSQQQSRDGKHSKNTQCIAGIETISRQLAGIADCIRNFAEERERCEGEDVEGTIAKTVEHLREYCSHVACTRDTIQPHIVTLHYLVKEKCRKLLTDLETYQNEKTAKEDLRRNLTMVMDQKPDLTVVREIQADLKKKKRELRVAIATAELEDMSDSEDDTVARDLHDLMKNVHKLYQDEEDALEKLRESAQSTHPELLIQYPQLGHRHSNLVKNTWDINDFVLPHTKAFIWQGTKNVREGFVGDRKPVYFVEHLLSDGQECLVDQAIKSIVDDLPGCFAIIVDKKNLKAYGITEDLMM